MGTATTLCLALATSVVHAEQPGKVGEPRPEQPARTDKPQLGSRFTAGKSQLGASFDFGLTTGNDDIAAANPYGFGFGADFGHTLQKGMYFGVEFNYFFGTTEQESGVESNTNVVQYGVEFGFDAGVSADVVMRPKLGIGVATAGTEENGDDYVASDSKGGLFVPVGLALLCSVGNGGVIGGDVRYGISLDDADLNGLLFSLGAGVAF